MTWSGFQSKDIVVSSVNSGEVINKCRLIWEECSVSAMASISLSMLYDLVIKCMALNYPMFYYSYLHISHVINFLMTNFQSYKYCLF